MKKIFLSCVTVLLALFPLGCGYTTKSTLPPSLRTISVEQFKNRIDFTSDIKRELYIPLMEVKVRNSIIDRFQFDGSLRISEAQNAAMTLKGELASYGRTVLRYTDSNDPLEYRIQIIMNLKLVDNATTMPMWEENGFTGESTFYVSGPNAKPESTAIDEAMTDLAKRIVERTIENW